MAVQQDQRKTNSEVSRTVLVSHRILVLDKPQLKKKKDSILENLSKQHYFLVVVNKFFVNFKKYFSRGKEITKLQKLKKHYFLIEYQNRRNARHLE